MKRPVSFLFVSLLGLSLLAQDQPARPPITGIAYVRVWITDSHQSLDFYRKTLGLTLRDAGCPGLMRPCFVVNEHQQLVLAEATATAVPPANLLAEIAFATPNIAAMRLYLLAHNTPVGAVARDINGTGHFSLLDPEGHSIAFVQAPAHRVYAFPAGQIGTHLIHAGFTVKDRTNEDRFYRDLLGFRVYWHGGMKDDQTDWVDMQVPDGTDWLEYMLNVSPNADKKRLGVMNHIALGVPDIKVAREQLLKNGWKPGEEPHVGRDGKWQLNLYDPDDTRAELMELTPVQKPCCSDYSGPHPKP